jgi:myo-inositol-1(or 4)-monophosphatase
MREEMERVARTAILEVGEIIRSRIGKVDSSGIQTKGPSDYVTEVDRKSEEIILKMVRRHFPDHHIMSEETVNEGWKEGYTWVIDPLDGTTNFIHGFPFVAVSIGICKDRVPELGFVLDPVRQELFWAVKGEGAYLNGERIRVRSAAKVSDALIATGFPFRAKGLLDPYLEVFRNVFHKVSGIRRAGAAALDLAYVAAGRVDGFWEPALSPWDIAAGSLLVSEAGGIVDDFWAEGNHVQNGHIVAGTPAVFPFLLEEVKTHLAPML